ncbi:T9SS C-terminal target domain-containing protein, partial [candidate division KSB1 bacterium]
NAEQLRLITYNVENYSGQTDRVPALRIIMRDIHPDLVCMQEIRSTEAVSTLLSQVFLQINDDWAAVPYHNGDDTDNAFFYRSSKLQIVSTRYIETTLRDIAEYMVRPTAGDTSLRVRVYSLHLKANSGVGDHIERRRQEALVLRGELDQLPAGASFMVCGDYNLLYSSEPAYELLLASTPTPNGQLNDPIDSPGHWEGNSAFAELHTIGSEDLNARFDFILVSNAMMDRIGSYVLPETYIAYGNDGLHFNRPVNELPNYAVSDSVAHALVTASDHIPVVTDFILASENSDVSDSPPAPRTIGLLGCYPNPFNSRTEIRFSLSHDVNVNLRIFNSLGQLVTTLTDNTHAAGVHTIAWNAADIPSGVYFYRMTAEGFTNVGKIMLIR